MTDDQSKSVLANVAVHMAEFPTVSFESTTLPIDFVIDEKGGKVCKNLKEAKKYAGQQYERLITQELNRLYTLKENIAELTVSN